jgi:5-methylcytosine-specific restriction endonuclease McrA
MVFKKATIPKALKEQVWLKWCGEQFSHKCTVTWCSNKITVFDWEAGHNIPESKGGSTTLTNLQPICGRCNKSMGNQYSINEWNKLGGLPSSGGKKRWFCCC